MPGPHTPPPVPVRGGYPKECRLRVPTDFQRVRSRGRRFLGRQCSLRVLATETGRARLGIAAPRAYGPAVRRNRFRRLAREAFRALRPTLGSVDVFVEPRKDRVEPTLPGLVDDMNAAVLRRDR